MFARVLLWTVMRVTMTAEEWEAEGLEWRG